MKSHKPKAKSTKLPPSPMKVLVLISLVHASWRDVLNGILEFSATRSDWDLRLNAEPGDFLAPQIEDVERAGYDGIVLASPGEVDYGRLAESDVPLVVAWGCPLLEGRRRWFSSFGIEAASTGEAGARHLMQGGRRACYGFVRSILDKEWPLKRQEAFLATVRAAGRNAVAYEHTNDGGHPRTPYERRGTPPNPTNDGGHPRTPSTPPNPLREWLAALPKPAAVMADTDRCAAKVVAACRDAGLAVPADVSVLGVDDDAFYALNTRPPLSSVAPPHKEQGVRIAAELDRLMRAKARGIAVEGRRESIHSCKVIVRESTRPVATSEILARRIAEFVRDNASSGPTVADVARRLNCSRRLVELAFKTTRRITVQDYIADCRIAEAKKRLALPRATVASAAAECGFKTAAHLSHMFKRRTGLSIREWRKGGSGSR